MLSAFGVAWREVVHGDFQLGAWLVQPSLNTVSRNGKTTRLEPKVMEVLVCLAEHTGEAVLEELLLPAVEHRRLEPRLVTQIRDRHSFHQMPPENGGFFFRRVVLPLLFHVFAPLVS